MLVVKREDDSYFFLLEKVNFVRICQGFPVIWAGPITGPYGVPLSSELELLQAIHDQAGADHLFCIDASR